MRARPLTPPQRAPPALPRPGAGVSASGSGGLPGAGPRAALGGLRGAAPAAPTSASASAAAAAFQDEKDVVYQLPVRDPATGAAATVAVKADETDAKELGKLLSAHFGGKVVGLLAAPSTVFPLTVVAAHPRLAHDNAPLEPLFSALARPAPLGALPPRRAGAGAGEDEALAAAIEAESAQFDTLEMLDWLAKSGLLSRRELEVLRPLANSEFVRAAMEVYQVEEDVEDLVDTLRRIVAIRAAPATAAASAPAPAAAPGPAHAHARARARAEPMRHRPFAEQQAALGALAARRRLLAFPLPEIEEIISAMHEDGRLDEETATVLAGLATKEHPYLQGVYEAFNDSGDADALATNLRVLASYFSLSHAMLDAPGAFSERETAAIVTSLLRGDPRVCGAWDVYVDEHDADDLCDSLRVFLDVSRGVAGRASKRAHSPATREPRSGAGAGKPRAAAAATQPARGGDLSAFDNGAAPTNEKTVLRRLVIWLHANGRVDDAEGAELMAQVDAGNPTAMLAARAYLAAPSRTQADDERLTAALLSLLNGRRRGAAAADRDEDEEEDASGRRGAKRREIAGGRGAAAAAAAPAAAAAAEEEEDEDAPLLRDDEDLDDALADEFYAFVQYLEESAQLSRAEAGKLDSLIEARDPRVLAGFDLFSQNRDLEDLVDTLRRLAATVELDTVREEDEEEYADEDYRPEEEDYEQVASKDDLYYSSAEDADNATGGVETGPAAGGEGIDMFSELNLTLPEMRTLKAAFEAKHPDVIRALDAYVETQDVVQLSGALERIGQQLNRMGWKPGEAPAAGAAPPSPSHRPAPKPVDPIQDMLSAGVLNQAALDAIPAAHLEEAKRDWALNHDEETFRDTVLMLAAQAGRKGA